LYARDHGVPTDVVAEVVGLTAEQAARAYRVIDSKRQVARYLLMPPLGAEETC
jgi:hypothetical protein